MKTSLELIPSGTLTSPKGFFAGAACADIKKKGDGRLDLTILYSEAPCTAAALFTTNLIKAAPVVLSQQRLLKGTARAIIVNSGCANACTGEPGLADAGEMADLAANAIGVPSEEVLVASTGVIGQRLPMALIREGVKAIALTPEGGHDLARAIMTTDTRPKEVAVRCGGFVVGGVAKGAGMIHPNMATMLSFLTTDAAVELAFLKKSLKKAADVSFNMISIDGDTSTNDTIVLLANGLAGGKIITEGSREAAGFQEALTLVCVSLAKAVVRDGEGASRMIEIQVRGARNVQEARQAARTVVASTLVKSAVHGCDPNWGRVVAAVGRSGVDVVESKIDLFIGDICLMKGGSPQPFDAAGVIRLLDRPEVLIAVDLNLAGGEATAWGCDLSEEYVMINSEYTT